MDTQTILTILIGSGLFQAIGRFIANRYPGRWFGQFFVPPAPRAPPPSADNLAVLAELVAKLAEHQQAMARDIEAICRRLGI